MTDTITKKEEGGKSSIDKVRDLLGRKMDDKKGKKKEIPFRLSSCVLRHTVHDGGASTIQQANQEGKKQKKEKKNTQCDYNYNGVRDRTMG
jgi:hypothetical protein